MITPLDEAFDFDGNGYVSDTESRRARSVLLRDRLRTLLAIYPDFAVAGVDGNGWIGPDEIYAYAEMIVRVLAAIPQPLATDHQVTQAAIRARAHEFVSRLPRGYETRIQEGVVNLSLGQRQLLSIARAIPADPRILWSDVRVPLQAAVRGSERSVAARANAPARTVRTGAFAEPGSGAARGGLSCSPVRIWTHLPTSRLRALIRGS